MSDMGENMGVIVEKIGESLPSNTKYHPKNPGLVLDLLTLGPVLGVLNMFFALGGRGYCHPCHLSAAFQGRALCPVAFNASG